MPVNSIVIAACLEWMRRHAPEPFVPTDVFATPMPGTPPRWATIRRAVEEAVAGHTPGAIYPFERFTKTAQNMLTAAQSEAEKSGNNYIGTEHLMLAAFADPGSQSALVLESLNVKEQTLRSMVEKALRGKTPPGVQRIIPTTRVKKVVEIAFRLCGAAGDPQVSTGHILLALATEGHGIAAHVLKDAGASAERIEAAMEAFTEPEA